MKFVRKLKNLYYSSYQTLTKMNDTLRNSKSYNQEVLTKINKRI